MNTFRQKLFGRDRHTYALLGNQNAQTNLWTKKHYALVLMLVALAAFAIFLISGSSDLDLNGLSCDSVVRGYECEPEIAQFWGQYSPYFSVPSDISTDVPEQCNVTFVQLLSRHGARDPTSSKSLAYNATVHKIQSNVKRFSTGYTFLTNYRYTLGADQLTAFGEQQMVNSGVQFYNRYEQLTRYSSPFVRSSGEDRVVNSAQNWTNGFRDARNADENAHPDRGLYPNVDVVIPERDYGVNNTLNHDLCTRFQNGSDSTIAADAQGKWARIFATPIQTRLNADLLGANLSLAETIYMMDLCPFNTVASTTGHVSPFCKLFTELEWHQYNYYESLGKWYGYSYGNPLGPSQGVGFTNELIARMTGRPVRDHTSTNRTLDEDPETFPLGLKLYADFSHDTDMTAILSALGLYNDTAQLPNNTIVKAAHAGGYSAAWTVPFAARVYFEKLACHGFDEEMVRVIVNDRVLPLTQCLGDSSGRCSLTAFIDRLDFARSGGRWSECFD